MKTLFDATKIGNMVLKNRFVRAAVADKTADGSISEEMIELYRKLAKGGVGSIITGYTLVDVAERALPVVALYNDVFIDRHRKLTKAAHEGGANILAQLVYIGSYTSSHTGGLVALAPSAVANLMTGTVAREANAEELKEIQKKFAQAALRAREAGYDGVELHAAHGFLLSQFMTPHYNQRTDAYGGSDANRSRMTLETYESVRGAVEERFPIWVKINSTDGIENGLTQKDCLYLCKKLTERGVDAIEVSGKWFGRPTDAGAYFEDAAAAIAKENSVPVVLTGGNRDPLEMTRVLNKTDIGYFGIARPLVSEPNLIERFQKDTLQAKGGAGAC
ncbi:MAG: NADH:flavin oxidoreductase [Synergistaceae bacterium]|nr:NADH:flavin oxidoreductase [Synergistaceae bacterium]